jgi:ketosteroid isomerase-like protein
MRAQETSFSHQSGPKPQPKVAMSNKQPLLADDEFFRALVQGDVGTLERVLGDDFVIIDVMSGNEADRPMFLQALESGQLTFESIEPTERRVRHYGGTVGIVIGRTRMKGTFARQPFAASSRYTHVFVQDGTNTWQLVSAQGTQIIE